MSQSSKHGSFYSDVLQDGAHVTLPQGFKVMFVMIHLVLVNDKVSISELVYLGHAVDLLIIVGAQKN